MAVSALFSSEIGELQSVLVHRPGLEIARITPDNREALPFDDPCSNCGPQSSAAAGAGAGA